MCLLLWFELLQETFNPGGVADGGWHRIGLTFDGGTATLSSNLEEVTAQIGQGIRTGGNLKGGFDQVSPEMQKAVKGMNMLFSLQLILG